MQTQRAFRSRGFVRSWCGLLAILLVAAGTMAVAGTAVNSPQGRSADRPGSDYLMTPAADAAAMGLPGAYRAVNTAQGIRAVFTDSVVRLAPLGPSGAGWYVDSSLSGFGIEGEMRPVGPGQVTPSGTRVSYTFSNLGLGTRFTNQAEGIDLGFTIAAAPATENRKDPQVIRLAVHPSRDLTAELAKNGQRLTFYMHDTQRAVSYSILGATDAEGRQIPAHLRYTDSDWALKDLEVIVVGSSAAYPLDISVRIVTRAEDEPSAAGPAAAPTLTLSKSGDQEPGASDSAFVPPPNDTCSGAFVIPPGPYPVLSAITTGADQATSAGDPTNSCSPAPTENGVWYTFTPSATAVFTIQACTPPTASNDGDGVLAVFTSTGSCGGPFTQVAGGCNDDGCHSLGPSIISSVSLTGGTTYYILASHYPTASGGGPLMTQYQLQISLVTPPANDTCSGAVPLTLNIPKQGTTVLAGNDYTLSGVGCYALPSPPTPVGQTTSAAPGRDVVYSFTPSVAGRYSFRVSRQVGGGNPILYVVSSCPAAPGAIATPPCLGAANRRATTVPVAEEVMCMSLGAGVPVFAFVDESALSASGGTFTIEVNPCVRETEANNTPPTANPLAGLCGIEGSTSAAADVDFFGLGAVATDARIFAMTDNTANNAPDYEMRVTNASDTYEYDDDDGDTSYGGSGSADAPVIAGAKATPGGGYFLRLNPFSAVTTSEPYREYHVVQPPSTAAVPETEPNGAGDPPNSAAPNYFTGVTSTTDQDDFGFNAAAGDLIFVAVDTDPDMNGTATDVTVGLFDPGGALVAQVNGSAAVSSTRTPVPANLTATTPVAPAETLVYRAPVGGTYIAAVLGVAAGPGNYLMSISKNCQVGGGGLGTVSNFPDIGKIVLELFPPFFPGGPPAIMRLRENGASDAQCVAQPQVLDTIQTELTAMNLTGQLPGVGTVTVRESPTRQSLGQTKVISPTEFDSFFDVFVTVDLPGVALFNDLPFHVVGHHTTQPPHNTPFVTQTVPNPDIFLYDPSDPPPGGAPRGRIRYVEHVIDPEFPPPDTDCFNTTLNGFFQTFPPFPPYSGTLLSHGTTDVRRGLPSPFPPGPQTVQTEMIELSLIGNDPFLGNYTIGLNGPPWPQSLGAVQGLPARAYPADAFFDVQPKINSSSVGPLVTQPSPSAGVRVEATSAGGNPIGTLPPGSGQTFKQTNITRLYQPGDLSTPVAQLTNIIHSIDTPVSWEPPPPPDKDCFDSRVRARITIFPPFFPGGCTETMILNGPFKVLRGAPFDPGNQRDIIRTIMACYRFAGLSGTCGLGSVLARPSTALASMGQIQSLAPDENFPADSFFDIFTELDTTSSGTLHTQDPTHMTATINSVPPGPGSTYLGPGTLIPLYNSANVQIGTIEIISHEIFNSIICPCECEPYIKIRPSKTTLDVGIPLGTPGVFYDVAKGIIPAVGHIWPPSFGAATCASVDGPGTIGDGSTPGPNQVIWYVSRESAFGQYYGTYNACPIAFQVGNRDTEIPPAACP